MGNIKYLKYDNAQDKLLPLLSIKYLLLTKEPLKILTIILSIQPSINDNFTKVAPVPLFLLFGPE